MNVGQLIKVARQKQNMKQKELAEGICSPSYLSKFESGTTIPEENIQQMLLARLNISIEREDIEPSAYDEGFKQLSERFKEVITRRDGVAADLLCRDIGFFSNENPFHKYKISLLLKETRLLLITSPDSVDVKTNISILIPMQNDMSHNQLFHLYMIQGIITYIDNRFANALHIFTNAYRLTLDYLMEDWELAELHYVLSLAALSDYRYILAIDHVQDALVYFNTKMLASRSIECLLILGISQKHTGDVNNALATFKSAKEIRINSEVSKSHGIIEQNLGACYSLLKDSERALHHFNQSLLAKDNPNKQIITILSIVKEYKKAGDRETAIDWVNKGIALLNQTTKQGKNPYYHHFTIYKALLYDENDLVSIFESSIHYFESKQNHSHCFIYCNILAEKLVDRKQFKLATTFYQKAFEYHLKYRNVQYWEELT